MKNTHTLSPYLLLLVVSMALAACTPNAGSTNTLQTESAPQTPLVTTLTNSLEASPTALARANGEEDYKISETYQTPEGPEVVNFIITMDGDTIKNVSLDIKPKHGESKEYQTKFANGINGIVAGKKLSEIEALDRVTGSSLTPKAFNKAIEKLKADIKS